jgi:hypothetical protein
MSDTDVPNNDPITNDKRIQAYLELYKQQMERFRQTQEVEWRANISLWTLLAGAVYIAKDHHLGIPRCVACIAVIVISLLHGWWLHQIHKSEQTDKIFWTRYRSYALLLLRADLREDEKECAKREWAGSWLLLEVGMTLILASFLAFLATRC